jgi:hypothetical protein
MKNITLSADENLITAARKQAKLQHTTLNAMFRKWLQSYAFPPEREHRFNRLVDDMKGKIAFDQKYSRDEANER